MRPELLIKSEVGPEANSSVFINQNRLWSKPHLARLLAPLALFGVGSRGAQVTSDDSTLFAVEQRPTRRCISLSQSHFVCPIYLSFTQISSKNVSLHVDLMKRNQLHHRLRLTFAGILGLFDSTDEDEDEEENLESHRFRKHFDEERLIGSRLGRTIISEQARQNPNGPSNDRWHLLPSVPSAQSIPQPFHRHRPWQNSDSPSISQLTDYKANPPQFRSAHHQSYCNNSGISNGAGSSSQVGMTVSFGTHNGKGSKTSSTKTCCNELANQEVDSTENSACLLHCLQIGAEKTADQPTDSKIMPSFRPLPIIASTRCHRSAVNPISGPSNSHETSPKLEQEEGLLEQALEAGTMTSVSGTLMGDRRLTTLHIDRLAVHDFGCLDDVGFCPGDNVCDKPNFLPSVRPAGDFLSGEAEEMMHDEKSYQRNTSAGARVEEAEDLPLIGGQVEFTVGKS
ncbi:unnamed protein product [Protopolystoma xenopodis]|uniref:Uncharacterized protein n=1 Tax=Protopolystoma xenopodis TaxID=117903 RepID=A0A448WF15_9PLAT|nr:unnamed protein product [Protopolystoma xenopodis]